jgi:hypothetical protein
MNRTVLASVAVSLSLALTGCGILKATGVMKDPPPNTTVALEVDRAKSFGDSATIVVPTLYLRVPVEGKASASNDSDGLRSIGRGNQGKVHVHAAFKVVGMDKAMAQDLAKAAYDDFVAKLRGAGYKVLTYDDIKDQVASLSRYDKDAAYGIAMDAGTMIATPTDDMAIKPGMGGNVISPYQSFGKSKLKDGATILIPSFTLASPLAKADTHSSGAKITLIPAMALTQGYVAVLTHGGGWGSAKLKKAVYGLSENTGTIVETKDNTPSVGNAISKTLSILGGVASRTVKSKAYELTIDKAGYRAAAVKGLSMFNEELAKVAAGAKKS